MPAREPGTIIITAKGRCGYELRGRNLVFPKGGATQDNVCHIVCVPSEGKSSTVHAKRGESGLHMELPEACDPGHCDFNVLLRV
jgi:hypothetical protein